MADDPPVLTARQLAWLRSELGAKPDDAVLQARYAELESVRDVAIDQVRAQKNALLDSPLQVSVNGVASVNNTENVKALERQLAYLVGLDDDPSDDEVPSDDEGNTPDLFEIIPLARTRGR